MNLQNIDFNKNFQLGVLGYPLSHTLSPIIHNYWMQKYQIKGSYNSLEIQTNDLTTFFKDNISKFKGLNVTIPHKINVFEFMDEIDNSAKVIGAINCISINNEGKLVGANTDAAGFMSGLRKFIPEIGFDNSNIMIIGAGGASRAVIYSLLLESVKKISISNRSRDRLKVIGRDFNGVLNPVDWDQKSKEISNADIIINCTSLGMLGNDSLDIDVSSFNENAIVIDLVYNPIETELIKSAKKRGHRVLNGLPMLLHQAALSWKIWFDILPDIDNELLSIIEGKLKI